MDVMNTFMYAPSANAVLFDVAWNGTVTKCAIDVMQQNKIDTCALLERFSDGHAQHMGKDADHSGSFIWQFTEPGSFLGDSMEVDNSFITGGDSGEVVWKAYGTRVQIINAERGELFHSFKGEINAKLDVRFPAISGTGAPPVVSSGPPFTDDATAFAWLMSQLPLTIKIVNGRVA